MVKAAENPCSQRGEAMDNGHRYGAPVNGVMTCQQVRITPNVEGSQHLSQKD
jgi:hypothetical protein